MFEFGTEWWEIIFRTTVVYLAIVGGFRLTGKRQIGQMAPFDLVIILLIANAVQNAMVGPDVSLVGGLLSAGTLLVVNYGVAALRDRFGLIERMVEGQPVLLVSDGVIVETNMRGERIDREELDQAIREHGVEGLNGVRLAVLEVNGTISIVPKSSQTITSERRWGKRRQAG